MNDTELQNLLYFQESAQISKLNSFNKNAIQDIACNLTLLSYSIQQTKSQSLEDDADDE